MTPLSLVLSLILLSLSQTLQDPRFLAESYAHHGDDWEQGSCKTGTEQSPIDIYPISEACDSMMVVDVEFKSGIQNFKLDDKGHTLQANLQYSSLFARNVDEIPIGYNALQFHFHAPSEHLVRGRSYDLELHLVHVIADEYKQEVNTDLNGRNLAVIGILFEVDDNGPANAFIDALHFETPGIPLSVDIKALLGSEVHSPLNYFTYKGSLTTEPCSELVNWFVLEKPLKIRSEQLQKFTRRYAGDPAFAGGNGDNRSVQPVYNRIVRKGGNICVEQLNYMYVFFGLFVAFNLMVFFVVWGTWPKNLGKMKAKQSANNDTSKKAEVRFNTVEVANEKVQAAT